MSLRVLASTWRSEAEAYRRRGLIREADFTASFAAELEENLRQWELEELTLEQAAAETGLAYDTLQRKVSSGEIPNAGRKGAPRIRRCDLRPGDATPPVRLETGEPDIAAETLRARGC